MKMTKTIEDARDLKYGNKNNGLNGLFFFLYIGVLLKVIVSDQEDWDHVSISCKSRVPTWDEMCYIKNLFFKNNEWALQYHPAHNKYINDHPNVLHLWRPQNIEVPKPPKWMV